MRHHGIIELFAPVRDGPALSPGRIRCHAAGPHYGLPRGDDVQDVLDRALSESSDDFPLALRRVAPQILLPLSRAAAARTGGRLFNGPSWKVVSCTFSSGDAGVSSGPGGSVLALGLRPTNWYTFAVTNMSLDATVTHGGRPTTIRNLLSEPPLPLEASRRANPLAVHVQMTVRWRGREWVVFGRRSAANLNNPGTWSGAAGGGVDPLHDRRPDDGAPDPSRTARREAEEELGLVLDDAEVRCLAFFLKEDQWQPVLLFHVEAARDPEEILAAHCVRGDGEVETLRLVPLTAADLSGFLSSEPAASTLRAEVEYLLSWRGRSG